MPQNCKYYLELSHNIKGDLFDSIYGLFPQKIISFDIRDLEVDMRAESKIQKVCNSILSID